METSREVVPVASSGLYDILLLDSEMRGAESCELCRAIRNAAGSMWATPNIVSRYRWGEIPSQCKHSEASLRTCIEWRSGCRRAT